MYDPLGEVIRELEHIVNNLSRRLGVKIGFEVTKAPPQYGYLAIPIHGILKSGISIEEALRDALEETRPRLIAGVQVVRGFLNFSLNRAEYVRLVITTINSLGDRYGWSDGCPQGKYIVEHTSANPAKPMHIGHGRNAVLGDSLARLLRFCGSEVRTHFYVNDCGDQVPYVGLGYLHAKEIINEKLARGEKGDHVMGLLYSVTYAVGEVKRLSKEIEASTSEEERLRLINERDEWVSMLKNLEDKDPTVRDILAALSSLDDIVSSVRMWARLYETGDINVRKTVREAVEIVLNGFKETLETLGITFDSWDWESEVAVDNDGVDRVIAELTRKAPQYVERDDGALIFRADKYAQDMNLWEELRLPRFIPKATLMRSDGTSLYLTRDIAYALWCWDNFKFHRLIRVIGSEQAHPQAQLKLALHAMGYRELARSIMHYSYEMVNLAGTKMSGRRGVYVALDDVIREAQARVLEIIRDRLQPEEAVMVARAVAIGAVRYAFLSVSPNKPLTFSWDRVLNLKQNSGPFIQYTYVRANSIIEKANSVPELAIPSELSDEEFELVIILGEYPSIIASSARDLRLEPIVDYVNRLALAFNSFYEKYPVINAQGDSRNFRLNLVNATRIVLGNAMQILGIPKLRKM